MSKGAEVLTAEQEAQADEVMMDFLDAGPQADTVAWIQRHPAHSRMIARLAADRWAGEPEGALPPTAEDAPALARMDARFDEVRRLVQARRQVTAPVAALSGLLAPAKERGLDTQAFAAKLDVPFAVVIKLHRRLIAPDSIPASFVRSLAECLGRTADDIAAYLRMPPTLAAGASYRADDTPTVAAQELFAEAISSDPDTTDTHRERWLSTPEI